MADKPARPGRTSLGANHRSTPEEGATEAPGAASGVSTPFEHGSLRRGPGVSARLSAWLDRFFFDRELFIRSKDRVRYVRLSAGAQKIAALTVVAVIGWAAAGSLGIGLQQGLLAERKAQIEQQQLAYLELMTEISDYHGQFTRITTDLEANQNYLLDVLREDGIAPDKLAGIADGLKPIEEAEDRMTMARESLRDRLTTFETSLKDIAQRNEALQGQVASLRATLHATEAERLQISEARARLDRRLITAKAQLTETQVANRHLHNTVAELRDKLAAAGDEVADLSELRDLLKADIVRLQGETNAALSREARLHQRLASLNVELHQAVARGDGLQDDREQMAAQLVAAFTQMGQMRAAQQTLLARLDDRTARSIEALEAALSLTGIEVEPLIAELQTEIRSARTESLREVETGRGGPFLPAALAGPPDPHSDRLEATYGLLDQRLDRWDAIKALFEAMPVAAPMREYRITSNFGLRKDPVNGKQARHEGIDLVGGWREPVLATAPGRVTFAGWMGAYGRMVEVDHGHGFKTRYAHLRNIEVEVGEEISFGHEVGQMGNSGRSTGPHLHYEILFEDRPYNPANFLKAGRHVFKG